MDLFTPRTRPESAYITGLFPAQRAFVKDPRKRKAALCGRRGGKTEGLVSWLIEGCERRPGSINVYIALSQKAARRILWTTLKRVVSRFGLPFTFAEQTLTATHANGSSIWVTGCPDQSQCEDLRGSPYGRVAIDEAGSFPSWLGYLVEDILDPALMDHDGELVLSGSPGLIPAGYFYEKTAGDRAWPTHSWTCLDNPHVPGAEYLARKMQENGWDTQHPTYVREYMGRWVRDDTAFIYPFAASKNFGVMPVEENRVYRVLSVDLGMVDNTAMVLGASHIGLPYWYCERAWYARKPTSSISTIDYIAAQIDQVRNEVQLDKIVVDEGGLGKMVVEDLRIRHKIPCEPAEKRDKLAAIHALRGGLVAGTVKLDEYACHPLVLEWASVAWNEDRDDHSEVCVDDLCDAALYNYRAHPLGYRPEHNAPKPGTREHSEALIAARKRELGRQIKKRLKREPFRLAA